MNLSPWFYKGDFPNGSDGNVHVKYDFYIDWGDGSETEHYSNDTEQVIYTTTEWGVKKTYNCVKCQHIYQQTGWQRVTITGECPNLYGLHQNINSWGAVSHPDYTYSIRKGLWGICVPKNCQSPLQYMYASFFGCAYMRYMGKEVFKRCSKAKVASHIFDGAGLEYAYPYTFSWCTNLESVDYAFEASHIKYIDKDFFRYNKNISSCLHLFHRASEIASIPNGLFDYFDKCTDFRAMFKSCVLLKEIPHDLFKKCINIAKIDECFCGGQISGDVSYPKIMNVTSDVPPLWDKHYWDTDEYKAQYQYEIENDLEYPPQYNISPTHTNYASGCQKASNIKQAIQNGWAIKRS